MSRFAISADCHVTEPLELWTANLPAGQRERGPRVEERDGRTCLVVEDHVARKLPPEVAAQGEPRRGAFLGAGDDVASRLRALDRDGVWAEVLYPNVAFFCTYTIEDPQLQVGTCRVYNEWIVDVFGACARTAPVGLLPVRDVDACVREVAWLADHGVASGLLPVHADFRPYNDAVYEPLWDAAEARGVALAFHVGTGRSQTPAHGPGATVVNYVTTVSSAMETVSYLCAAGVLERHPGLCVGMVECGAGWLAWTLEAMDDAYREHRAWVRPVLRELPSAYFRRQGFVTFQRDPVGIANVERTGARCLLWGSDHPHPEGTFPDSQRVLDEQLRDVPNEIAERIVFRNAAELYSFALPDPPV